MINESLHLGMSVFVVPLYPARRDLFNEWQLHVIPLSQGMKGRKNIVWIFIFFSSLRLAMESRKLDPDNLTLVETSLTLLLVPFSPLEGLKGHLFYVTNLSPIYVWLTRRLLCKEAAGSRRWVWAPCNGPVGSTELGEPLLRWCLGPPTQPLSPDGAPGPDPMAWLWVSLYPKPPHHRGWRSPAMLQLSITEGMFPGRLGCPLLQQPQLLIWIQKLAAPGWEHDLVRALMWAPGLLLLSQCFFCSGITSAKLEVCPCLWAFGCLGYILSTQKERTIKGEENKHALFLKASSFPSVRILIDWQQKLKHSKKTLQNSDFNKIILFF